MKRILILILFPVIVQAGVMGTFKREGVIKNFDEKTVTLIGKDGKPFSVPRSKIGSQYKIQSGEKVAISIDASEVKERIKARKERTKKRLTQ